MSIVPKKAMKKVMKKAIQAEPPKKAPCTDIVPVKKKPASAWLAGSGRTDPHSGAAPMVNTGTEGKDLKDGVVDERLTSRSQRHVFESHKHLVDAKIWDRYTRLGNKTRRQCV